MNNEQRREDFKRWLADQPNRYGEQFSPKVPRDYAARLEHKGFLVNMAKAQLAENLFEVDNPRIILALGMIFDEMADIIPTGQKDDYADLKVALKWYEEYLRAIR